MKKGIKKPPVVPHVFFLSFADTRVTARLKLACPREGHPESATIDWLGEPSTPADRAHARRWLDSILTTLQSEDNRVHWLTVAADSITATAPEYAKS
ncbi:MAG: hypothetical protein WCO97_10710 [bacterium]